MTIQSVPFVLEMMLVFSAVSAPGLAAPQGSSQIVTVNEGTNIAATASPDQSALIFDLQGVLWSLPFEGGVATRLTEDFLEPARPDWSPRSDIVAFEAYATGGFHIWTMNPDGSDLRQRTDGHNDDREPRFSPDGAKIAFSSDRGLDPDGRRSYDVWVLDLASGGLSQITSNPTEEFEPSWSPNGFEIAFVNGNTNGNTIDAVTLAGDRRTLIPGDPTGRVNSPSWSPDGKSVAYTFFKDNKSRLMVSGNQVAEFNDVFPFPAQWLSDHELLYTADGKIRVTDLESGSREVPFEAQFSLSRPKYDRKAFDFDSTRPQQVKGIVSPAISPNGRQIVFEALNELWLFEIGSRRPRQLTSDGFFKVDPAWSRDGRRIAYSSDKAGTEDIYVLDLVSGRETRVTTLPGAEIGATWSPDGSMLAFQDQTGATFTIDIGTGDVRQVLGALFAPGRPTWSADGRTLALTALKPYTTRFREGTSQIVTVNLETGDIIYREPAPFQSLSTRGDDGPVWSPDGSAMAFVMNEGLWVLPVDADGAPTGPPTQITHEVTDAPTWTGDSQNLLYLSNGKFRMVSRDGSNARNIPMQFNWRQDKPTGRVLIHAGLLWDGRGPDQQQDVDIVVANNRIVSVEPHQAKLHGLGREIDASNLTVIPGLFESHTHQMISGKFYGDRLNRLWLAYGVTTLNSVGDPAYRAIEGREALASGERLGPRLFATGEAIDGERIFYNFMRPTTTEEAFQLQLLRGRELGYDMVKTYVRLPHAMQARVVPVAHDMGVWTSSHYMLPGMASGMDGQSHVSATTRLGFAYTRSGGGVSYQDVIDLYPLSGMHLTSTTFNPVLLLEDPQMVEDIRIQALYPPWEGAALRARRDLILSTDPTVSLDSLEKEEATVMRIRRGGGYVLTGTDSPLDNPAIALHLNLRSQVHFGSHPWEALQSATIVPARMLGVEKDLGTIEPGKLADLTFIEGNPMESIADVTNVRSVMKNGRLYSVDDLMAPFDPSRRGVNAEVQGSSSNRRVSPLPASKSKFWWHDPSEAKEYFQHVH